jgi:hypothetical protein
VAEGCSIRFEFLFKTIALQRASTTGVLVFQPG